MYGWRGIASGALALVVLSVVVTPAAANRVGGVADFVVELAHRFLDPTVPAIPARTEAPKAPPAGFVANASSPTGGGGGFSDPGTDRGGGGGGGITGGF